ncbi:spore coat polysaccharide biosynthesis protein SpsF [Gracilibacillus orientalis]|uniref:Spore coat polysaccharide biosynthesis protein SpsF n=1 Tax=Gracilibacillus orientalis TaxID=334253 RepID=A0A1I4P798_9BACI|nr:glycosyltransferase family protein [Gracilibacillus orientalis]SFM23579.1 spore coat polysaccharide biosynthesis protein SpsF [Gracilibacillus orientalis]
MKVVAIIQARMGSTRLPGKVLKQLKGETVLSHVMKRVSQSNLVDDIVVATTVGQIDDPIVKEVVKSGYQIYRGSENDVLDRYYKAALQSSADIVVRITSDCPLIDPIVIDKMLNIYIRKNYTLVANIGLKSFNRTFPRGLDVEIFSIDTLDKAVHNASAFYQREHVTPYMYENECEIFYFKNNKDMSNHRWTLDTAEDFDLIKEIYEKLYSGEHDFFMDEILSLFEMDKELFNINAHIEQKTLK